MRCARPAAWREGLDLLNDGRTARQPNSQTSGLAKARHTWVRLGGARHHANVGYRVFIDERLEENVRHGEEGESRRHDGDSESRSREAEQSGDLARFLSDPRRKDRWAHSFRTRSCIPEDRA